MTNSDGRILYQDKYITLTEDALILKMYYFPTFASKAIPLDDVERVRVGTEPELGLGSTWKKKSWGMAFSNVWWACRMGREFDGDNEANFVASLKSTRAVRCGFSVENPKAFHPLIGRFIE